MKEIPSADQFRSVVSGPVLVDIPGTTFQFRCCRPDLPTLTFKRLINPTMLASVAALRDQIKGGGSVDTRDEDIDQTSAFLDRWVCAACLEPRVIADEAPDDPDALHVGELGLHAKIAILVATQPRREVADMTDFRDRESAGDRGGPDGEAVRDPAVAVAAD